MQLKSVTGRVDLEALRARQFARWRKNHRKVPIEALESRRLLSAGELDPTFGTGGGIILGPALTSGDAVAVQSDGKVLLAYDRRSGLDDYLPTGGMNVVRYNTNGTIDGSFGQNGIATINVSRQS